MQQHTHTQQFALVDAATFAAQLESSIAAHIAALRSDVLAALKAQQQQPEKRYFTRRETAQMLRLTLATLNKRLRDGEIRFERNGRRVLIPAEQFSKNENPASQI
jgi:excisionase family DNA binding protein